MSAAGRALSKALDKPEDWIAGGYRLIHKPSKQIFWVGSGGFFFDGHADAGTPKCLGLIERHWLYRKAGRVGSYLVAQALAKTDPA